MSALKRFLSMTFQNLFNFRLPFQRESNEEALAGVEMNDQVQKCESCRSLKHRRREDKEPGIRSNKRRRLEDNVDQMGNEEVSSIHERSVKKVTGRSLPLNRPNQGNARKVPVIEIPLYRREPSKDPPNILDKLPAEVFSDIMKILVKTAPCFAASLGLTCRTYYSEFKRQLPRPLDLHSYLWHESEKDFPDRFPYGTKLYDLIGNWINKDNKYVYRESPWLTSSLWTNGPVYNCSSGRYLSIDAYGARFFGSRVLQLEDAYRAYHELSVLINKKRKKKHWRHITSPYNMGAASWFKKAVKLILKRHEELIPHNSWMMKINKREYEIYKRRTVGGTRIMIRPSNGTGRSVSLEDFGKRMWGDGLSSRQRMKKNQIVKR